VLVALFHLERLSVAQIAGVLGIPAGTLNSRLLHARERLRATAEA
jgi:RNA polymerase sigma-70 factor (ECF subfamily)